jgi:ParB-like chromosome segregation protein Spo0J
VRIPVSSLRPSDSPRLDGEDSKHIQMLAESEAELPPITVQRTTMRIIDGMHRLKAAVLRGEHSIEACLVDVSPEDAFVLAVEANIAHGLPLSLADRKAAAVRILRAHPQRSDRAIAASTGLSPKTVGVIRRCVTEGSHQSQTRVGRDGRARPLSSVDGRRRASELLRANPDASLRQVAQAVGLSPTTVRDVRQRLRQDAAAAPRTDGAANDPTRIGGTASATGTAGGGTVQHRLNQIQTAGSRPVNDRSAILRSLRADPSLRFNESGRLLLRLLDIHTIDDEAWERLVSNIPEHCTILVAKLAHECADRWQRIADSLEQRHSATA